MGLIVGQLLLPITAAAQIRVQQSVLKVDKQDEIGSETAGQIRRKSPQAAGIFAILSGSESASTTHRYF
jgi:hypothetical protein